VGRGPPAGLRALVGAPLVGVAPADSGEDRAGQGEAVSEVLPGVDDAGGPEHAKKVPAVDDGSIIEAELVLLAPDRGHDVANPAVAYLTELGSAESRRRLRGALAKAGGLLVGADGPVAPETLPWWDLRRVHVLAVRSLLEEVGASASSINVTLSALRGVARACWLDGRLAGDVYHQLAAVKSVKQERLPAGRLLGPGELQALFASCARDAADGHPAGPRDGAVLGMLYAGGLRREEVSRLGLGDVDAYSGEVVVRAGKGNKDRNVYLAAGARAALSDWLVLRGEGGGPLWSRVRKGGHLVLPPTGLSERSVANVCVRRAERAGVKAFTPHDLRRTFISNLLDGGVDLVTVQKLAGHSSPSTTGRYDRRGEATKREAARALHVAYS